MSYTKVEQSGLPSDSLLIRYQESGDFTDCYLIKVSEKVDFQKYVYSFYTSWLFKLERFVLKWIVNKPSTDQEVLLLAKGNSENFAAWSVEDRAENQLLLCDYQGQTRSWLRVVNLNEGNTLVYFGSAVISKKDLDGKAIEFSRVFKFIGWFHHLYSKALITCAVKKLLSY